MSYLGQPRLDMPEILWKAYIDFEIEQEETDRARDLYKRLLNRTQHVKVWLSFAQFELQVFLRNSYLSLCIIDSFPWIYEWQILRLKPVLLDSEGQRPWLNKMVLIVWFLFWYFGKLFVIRVYTWFVSMDENHAIIEKKLTILPKVHNLV